MTRREEFERAFLHSGLADRDKHLCKAFWNKGFLSGVEAAKTQPQWIPVSERLPVCFKSVFAIQETVNGSRIIVIAKFIGKYMEESDGEQDDFYDYKEETDTYYLPEGWYEQQVNWDEYSGIYIGDKITHWMPLPELPEAVK